MPVIVKRLMGGELEKEAAELVGTALRLGRSFGVTFGNISQLNKKRLENLNQIISILSNWNNICLPPRAGTFIWRAEYGDLSNRAICD
jgi:hypothetical protein